MKPVKEISDKLAKKHNLSIAQASTITDSQFSFLRQTIANGELKSVYCMLLGRFLVKPGRRDFTLEYRKYRETAIKAGQDYKGMVEYANEKRRLRDALQKANSPLPIVPPQQT